MSIRLSRIGRVDVRVRDVDIAKRVYTKALGFEVVEEDAEHGGCFTRLASDLGNDGHTLDPTQVEDAETAMPGR